ncbi:hypothetical protein D3C75_791410 [compost metagenome]
MQRLNQLNRQTHAIAVVPGFSHDFLWIRQRCERADREDLLPGSNTEALCLLAAVRPDIDVHFADVAWLFAFIVAQQVDRGAADNTGKYPFGGDNLQPL